MDFISAAIGAVSVAICFIPFAIMHRNRINKEQRMLRSLIEIANQQNCNISQHEFCGDFAIGLDKANSCVFFYKKTKDNESAQFVNLTEIQSCRLVKTTRSIEINNKKIVVIVKLEFCFIPKFKSKAEINFELYSEERNLQLSGELQLQDRWFKIINNHLKNI